MIAGPRIFVENALVAGAEVTLDRAAANHLAGVLRLRSGDPVLVFNGRDGEWRATLDVSGRREASLRVDDQARDQPPLPAVAYLFAPLKHARLDYVVQKAVEMGAGSLEPVMTRRTVPGRVNGERMRLHVIEAAQQCGVLAIPGVRDARPLAEAIADLGAETTLVFCDEDAPVASPLEALGALPGDPACPVAVLIGPEGGFDDAERATLRARPGVIRLSLGPRILRADTAAVAALALVNAARGGHS